MTGLDVENDVIIEIAVIVTDGQLVPVDEGVDYVIRTDKAVLDG
jgi:oligoribonuclease